MKRFLVAFLLLLIPFSAAIGVSPPSGTIEFVPGAEGAFDVMLRNSYGVPISTEVKVSGNLAEHFTVDAPRIGARSGARATVSYALPETIPPGPNYQRIEWTESFFTQAEGAVVARTAVTAKFSVWKPYPGRYAEIQIKPTHVREGEATQVRVDIQSRGEDAVSGDVVIRVMSPDGELRDTLYLEDVRIEGDASLTRYVRVRSENYPPGKYEVEAVFDYNAAVARAEETLIIGTRSVSIENLTRTYYKDKDINRFEVTLESLWNEPLSGVSASMQLGANAGQTPAITLAPFETKTVTGYWDTDTSLSQAEHPALVTATFTAGEPVERLFSVMVYNETPQPQAEEPATITLGMSDVLFLVLALLFVGYFLVHVMRRHQ